MKIYKKLKNKPEIFESDPQYIYVEHIDLIWSLVKIEETGEKCLISTENLEKFYANKE